MLGPSSQAAPGLERQSPAPAEQPGRGFAGRRGVRTPSLLVAAIGFVAALRNVTPVVAPVAEINNYVLPIWLIVLGVVLARRPS